MSFIQIRGAESLGYKRFLPLCEYFAKKKTGARQKQIELDKSRNISSTKTCCHDQYTAQSQPVRNDFCKRKLLKAHRLS